MIQRLLDLEIPTFPEVGKCDKWMLRIFKNYSLATMIDDEVLSIEHISHLSKEGDGCTQFAIHADECIDVTKSSDYSEQLNFSQPYEIDISYFVDDDDDIIYLSDNPEELKSIALALRIAEYRQPRPIDETEE